MRPLAFSRHARRIRLGLMGLIFIGAAGPLAAQGWNPIRFVAVTNIVTNAVRSAAADFNGDAAVDVAVTFADSRVAVLTNNGLGSLAPSQTIQLTNEQAYGIVAFDADGDGDADLGVSHYGGTVFDLTFLENTAGQFAPLGFTTNTDEGARLIVAKDVTGDDRADVVAPTTYGSPRGLAISTNDGSGRFTESQYLDVPMEPSDLIALEDWTGDGARDLAAALPGPNGVALYTNDGRGTFVAQGGIGVASPGGVLAGEFDGAPGLDLAILSLAGLSIYTNDGGGGLVASGLTNKQAIFPEGGALVDFEDDLRPDLVFATSSELVLYRMIEGGFLVETNGWGNFLTDVTTADLDGDGDPELLSCDKNESHLRIHFPLNPRVSRFNDQLLVLNGDAVTLPFKLGQPETDIVLSAATSDPSVVPLNRVELSGAGANRFLTLLPAMNDLGTAQLSVVASNTMTGEAAVQRFWVTVADGMGSSGGGTGASTGGTTGSGSSGSGSTGGTSGSGTTAGTSSSGGSTSGTGTGQGTGAATGGGGPEFLAWVIELRRPKEGRTVKVRAGKGFKAAGRLSETGLEPKFEEVTVELAVIPESAAGQVATNGIPWRAEGMRVGRASKKGTVKFRSKGVGQELDLASGERFDLAVRATDSSFDAASTETNATEFEVR